LVDHGATGPLPARPPFDILCGYIITNDGRNSKFISSKLAIIYYSLCFSISGTSREAKQGATGRHKHQDVRPVKFCCRWTSHLEWASDLHMQRCLVTELLLPGTELGGGSFQQRGASPPSWPPAHMCGQTDGTSECSIPWALCSQSGALIISVLTY